MAIHRDTCKLSETAAGLQVYIKRDLANKIRGKLPTNQNLMIYFDDVKGEICIENWER